MLLRFQVALRARRAQNRTAIVASRGRLYPRLGRLLRREVSDGGIAPAFEPEPIFRRWNALSIVEVRPFMPLSESSILWAASPVTPKGTYQAAYAEIEGVTPEEHVLQRYGSILEPARLGEMVADVVENPRYGNGVAYGFRLDAGVFPLDLDLATA